MKLMICFHFPSFMEQFWIAFYKLLRSSKILNWASISYTGEFCNKHTTIMALPPSCLTLLALSFLLTRIFQTICMEFSSQPLFFLRRGGGELETKSLRLLWWDARSIFLWTLIWGRIFFHFPLGFNYHFHEVSLTALPRSLISMYLDM